MFRDVIHLLILFNHEFHARIKPGLNKADKGAEKWHSIKVARAIPPTAARVR